MSTGGWGGLQTAGRPQVCLGGQCQTELPGTSGRSLGVYVRGNCCLVLFEACWLLALAGGT